MDGCWIKHTYSWRTILTDMFDMALIWVIIGGFLEPVWVIGLKKYDETKSLLWGAFTVFFMILSPMFLSFAMDSMNVGVAYSIWTGIGAVFTMIVGAILYKDRIDRIKVLLVLVIITGVAGLQLTSGVH